MRRFLAALLSMLLLIAMPGLVLAEPPIQVLVDDAVVQFDAQPFIENDRTLVPVRALSEKLGFTVSWDEGEQRVTLSKGDSTIVLWVGSNKVMVNGKEATIDVPAKKVGDRVFVPVRFVSEQLGTAVRWDGKTNSVVVSSGNGLLKQVSKGQSELTDMHMTADIRVAMSGMNPQTGAPESLTIPIQMDMQVYQGNMLITMKTDMSTIVPGMGAMTIRVAGKDGTLYTQDPTTGVWKESGKYDPKLGTDQPGLSSTMGAADLLKIQESFLKGAQVKVAGVEEIDGVKVVRIDVNLSNVDFQSLIAQMGGMAALPPGAAASMEMKTDRFLLSYWFDQETQFMYKATIDMGLTMSAEGETINMSVKGDINARPMSEPIQFPALPQPSGH